MPPLFTDIDVLMRITHSQCHYDHCSESEHVLSFSLYIQPFLSLGLSVRWDPSMALLRRIW